MENTVMQKIKNFLSPAIAPEVQRLMDADIVRSLQALSLVAALVELVTLILFVATRRYFDAAAWASIGSVLYCTLVCGAGWLFSRWKLRQDEVPHAAVAWFKVVYFLALSVWAVWNGWRLYVRGEQMLTFFAVELILVCFVPVRPWISTALTVAIYAGLYVACYTVDGAAGLHPANYVILVIVSVSGMIARYRAEVRTCERTAQLQKNNELLAYANRHDGLTALRNRAALDEDVSTVVGQALTVFMLDVNYFKEINDTYGHTVGDEVLRQAARTLKLIFPDCLRYRFGGDEFLVLDIGSKAEKRDTYEFSVPAIPRGKVLFSIGSAEGVPQDHDELFALIAKADEKLYEVKRVTHDPAYGGHDRRRRI